MTEATDRRRISLDIEGMTCGSCVPHVEERFAAVDGVTEMDVRYPEGSAQLTVEVDVDPDALVEALTGTPYSATLAVDAVVDVVVDVAREAVVDAADGGRNGVGGGGHDGRLLAVVGGGSAGFAAAIRAVEAGARVVMIQEGTIGGTCVNVGCVPSKTLIRAGEARHMQASHPFDGVAHAEAPVDWARVRQGKDDLVSALRKAKYEDVLAAYPEITLIEGRGVFDENGALHLADGAQIKADATVVATGSSAWIPDVPGLADAGYLDSTALLDVEELPASLVVLGAGSVGLELAQAYARLGVRVTVLARSRLLSHGDQDVSEELAEQLRAEGIDVRTGVTVARVERTEHGRCLTISPSGHVADKANPVSPDALTPMAPDTTTVVADEVLVAVGRIANSRNMGLEHAGVALGPAGEILVDAQQRTANPHIYAAGDVTGGAMHVYVAAKAGNVAADNALGGSESSDFSVLPQVTFTDPGVAVVGLTEEEARARGVEPLVSKLPLEHVPRALAARDTRGFIKLVADASTRRIIGAHILAPEAGEMIMEPAMAIRFGLTIEDITSMLHPYLTLSEGIKLAALTFDKDVEKLSCCAV
jgi:mercuric reductase